MDKEFMQPETIKLMRGKLTQAVFAHRLGLKDYHAVMHWERGTYKPSYQSQQKLKRLYRKFVKEIIDA
jgi:DNA-binding transcriptional regulator YiaG